MARQLSEQKMIEGNIFLHEQRLQSPIRRFVDKSFTPTTYFHIKTSATTVDRGYQNVAEILGKESPIRFSRIDNFPLYGLEQIVIQLQDGDQGLDGGYEGDAVIMADTITPYQNDFFMITHLKDSYIFRVTNVEYDTIYSVNCYKIQFMLEYIDNEKAEDLQTQTHDEFTCVLENIGTEDKCIIEKGSDVLIQKINAMFDEIAQTYMTFYYNERYNSFLGDFINGTKLYDPFQVMFINKNHVFQKKHSLDSLILTDHFYDARRKIKYEKSIYRFIEKRDVRTIDTFDYVTFTGSTNRETGFYRWLDDSVKIVDIPKAIDPTQHYQVLTKESSDIIRMNAPTDSKVLGIIQQFIRDKDMNIHDIDLTLHDEIMFLDDANLEVFFFTPILLYIIKELVNKELEK